MPTRAIPQQFRFEPLDARQHDRAGFSCGVEALDHYLKTQATQDMRRHVSAVFVLSHDGATIAGFCTLSQYAISADLLPPQVAAALRLPRYSLIPATLLGRLAVDCSFQRKGIGELLLFTALERAMKLSTAVASATVVVDAKDEKAIDFYSKYGFRPLVDAPRRLVLPMRTIRTMFE